MRKSDYSFKILLQAEHIFTNECGEGAVCAFSSESRAYFCSSGCIEDSVCLSGFKQIIHSLQF